MKGMELTFEKAWNDLKEAIGRANIELEIATNQANETYKKAIAPYRKALQEAAIKEGRTLHTLSYSAKN